MVVWYEWDIEEYEGEDIVDHNHADKFSELPKLKENEKLVLVRNTEDSRLWAYVENNKLPEYFARPEADGNYYATDVKVPKRFHKELI